MSKCIVEIYSRVCGFFRPISQWNPGRLSEFFDRQPYNINNIYNNDGTTVTEQMSRPSDSEGCEE